MKFYPVDETGTPLSSVSSQHSYVHQSNTPLRALQDAINEQIYGNPYSANSATKALQDSLGLPGSSPGHSGSGSSGSGGSSGSSSPFVVRNGQIQYRDPNMQMALEFLHQEQDRSNAWSAEQAQKQMDFQREMSDTAHQREVADLKAAGLNPVLSAGGNGAQAMTGSAPQSDSSAMSAITELALGALSAVSNTAVGVAGATSSGGGIFNNYFVRRALGAASNALGYGAVGKLIFGRR